MAVIKSKHTRMFIAVGDTEAIRVTRLRQIGFPDGEAADIDISDFDDEWDQSESGRKATGSAPIEIIYDSEDHEALEELYSSGRKVHIMVTAPVSETEGVQLEDLTVTGGVIAPPADALAKSYYGYIRNFSPTVGDNDVWRATVNIRGSGAVTTHRPA